MAWLRKDTATTGEALAINMSDGWYIGFFGAISETDVLEAVRAVAVGWNVLSVSWEKGFLGIGDKLHIFGMVRNATIPTETVRREVITAINGFWNAGGADATVFVSNNVAEPFMAWASEWTGTIQIVAIAVLAVAVVYGISELRKIIK